MSLISFHICIWIFFLLNILPKFEYNPIWNPSTLKSEEEFKIFVPITSFFDIWQFDSSFDKQ